MLVVISNSAVSRSREFRETSCRPASPLQQTPLRWKDVEREVGGPPEGHRAGQVCDGSVLARNKKLVLRAKTLVGVGVVVVLSSKAAAALEKKRDCEQPRGESMDCRLCYGSLFL